MECWKNSYPSKGEAQRIAAYRRRKKGVPKLYVYKCPNGDHWHITRNNPKVPIRKLKNK